MCVMEAESDGPTPDPGKLKFLGKAEEPMDGEGLTEKLRVRPTVDRIG